TTQFEAADRIAEAWGFSRGQLDEFAVVSQRRAADAIDDGRFASQIVAVNGVRVDEGPRPTTPDGLAGLKVNLKDRPGALHPAGTSSQISDGASAVLLMTADRATALDVQPRARVLDSILVGSDPVMMLTGPITATEQLLERNKLTLDDIDVIEVNEAFASV